MCAVMFACLFNLRTCVYVYVYNVLCICNYLCVHNYVYVCMTCIVEILCFYNYVHTCMWCVRVNVDNFQMITNLLNPLNNSVSKSSRSFTLMQRGWQLEINVVEIRVIKVCAHSSKLDKSLNSIKAPAPIIIVTLLATYARSYIPIVW